MAPSLDLKHTQNKDDEARLRLLSNIGECSSEYEEIPIQPQTASSRGLLYHHALLMTQIALGISILLNLVMALLPAFSSFNIGHPHLAGTVPSVLGKSPWSGIVDDIVVRYEHETPFWVANETMTDSLWTGISTDALVVALTDEYAEAHGIELAARFPWDHNRGRYYLRVFHQLHCLKYVRQMLKELQRTGKTQLIPLHADHCLDVLRKDVICYADDTPMPAFDEPPATIGEGQLQKCRSIEAVIEWAAQPEQDACHRSPYHYGEELGGGLGSFVFCDKQSQHYPAMQKYIQEHGMPPSIFG